jgi:hypothetical protein
MAHAVGLCLAEPGAQPPQPATRLAQPLHGHSQPSLGQRRQARHLKNTDFHPRPAMLAHHQRQAEHQVNHRGSQRQVQQGKAPLHAP